MALIKTSNPALGKNTFSSFAQSQYGGSLVDAAARMTLSGTVNKTGILLLCTIATAAWTWNSFMQTHDIGFASSIMMLGLLGGFVVALVTTFKMSWAPVTSPIYALLEGLALGGISAIFELKYPGIAMEAVALTFGTLFVMLLIYKTGLIKVTQKFRIGVVAATGGIAAFYFLTWVLSFFHITIFSSVYGSGLIGIGFSLFVVAIASLNLVLDFDFIEQGVAAGAPKYMEWYGAFGIIVTLVWLYLEILILLSKLRSR
jgi:uncharacterized YccA/Bax inhibitor family protein